MDNDTTNVLKTANDFIKKDKSLLISNLNEDTRKYCGKCCQTENQ